MDDSQYGREAPRGHWAPAKPVSYGPAMAWPPQPRAFVKWLFGFPGYFLPWNLFYALSALAIWAWLTPSLDKFESFSLYWAGVILLRNLGLAVLVYGAWHLWLYVWRKQGTAFKYNRSGRRRSSRASCSTTKPMTTCSTRWRDGRRSRSSASSHWHRRRAAAPHRQSRSARRYAACGRTHRAPAHAAAGGRNRSPPRG